VIDKTLAHYEILEQIGSGGMGDVYRARDTKLGREIALKVLPPEFSRDPERRTRFVREAQAIATLKHPNIVTIYSVEEADGTDFITMELVEGDTLTKRIKSGGVSLDAFFEYAVPLADAISSAHDQGITHRDLKPANIMFDRDGRLKVLDFGLAKLISSALDNSDAETVVESGDTGVGQILGTAAYMSPEQAEGKPIDNRTDIFSLGIVLYELATGDRPFKGDTQISTISSILKDTPPHISEIRHELPRHVGRIINHCLEKSPDRRFQSAKDVRNDLEGLKREVDSGSLSADSYSGVNISVTGDDVKVTGGQSATAVATIGVKRTPIIVIGVIVVGAILAWALWPDGDGGNSASVSSIAPTHGSGVSVPTTPARSDRQMAVVLPFDNLGSADDAYFAAGMTDELTSRLSAVKGIGVISRTSAKQYDRTGKTVRQIGEDLGVDYVVEGSVRFAKRAGGSGKVRITPLLIRVKDDTQMWSQTYDRNIDDVFTVQTEIANNVVDALGVELGATEKEMLATVPTDNMEAYEAYIKGKEYKNPGGDFIAEEAEQRRLFELATRLDPQFLDAWVELSMHHSSVYNSPMDKTEARINAARAAMQRAEAIDPDNPRTRLARGAYYYYGFRDYERALEEFVAATQVAPNDSEALAMVAYIYRRQGKMAEHIATLEQALQLDPRNDNNAFNLAGSYASLREFDKAIANYDRALDLNPDQYSAVMGKAQALSKSTGDYKTVMAFLDSVKPSVPRSFSIVFANIRYGELVKARSVAEQLPEIADEFTVWKVGLLSQIDYLEGGRNAAMKNLKAAEQLSRAILQNSPGNSPIRQGLSVSLALQGRGDEAVQEARLAADITAKDQYEGPGALENLAGVYTIIGRHNDAIDILKRLLKTTYQDPITEMDLKQDPRWAPLREQPRFSELVPPSS